MKTIDVPIDVTKMSTARQGWQRKDCYCLQGWINKQMIGDPEGLAEKDLRKISEEGKKHLNFRDHHYPSDGRGNHRGRHLDFINAKAQANWPNISEFSNASNQVMLMMQNKDYAGVKSKLQSYMPKVGINFIPKNLPTT